MCVKRKQTYIIFTPWTPHLYGKTGVYKGIQYFPYFCSKHRLSEKFQFLEVKFSIHLNRHVFEMSSEDSDQLALLRSLIRTFTGCISDSQGCKASFCEQRRLKSDCAYAQTGLSLRWAHMLEGTFSDIAALILILSNKKKKKNETWHSFQLSYVGKQWIRRSDATNLFVMESIV